MLVLLDQGTPVPLRTHLSHHTVRTVFQEGWATFANGDLLNAAEAAGFQVFVTTDKNLRYQQDLSGRRIAIVVIGHAQWPGLEPHVRLVVAAIDRALEGAYSEVEIPSAERFSFLDLTSHFKRLSGIPKTSALERAPESSQCRITAQSLVGQKLRVFIVASFSNSGEGLFRQLCEIARRQSQGS